MRSLVFNANVCRCLHIGADGCHAVFGAATNKHVLTHNRGCFMESGRQDLQSSTQTPGWSFRKRWKRETSTCRQMRAAAARLAASALLYIFNHPRVV